MSQADLEILQFPAAFSQTSSLPRTNVGVCGLGNFRSKLCVFLGTCYYPFQGHSKSGVRGASRGGSKLSETSANGTILSFLTRNLRVWKRCHFESLVIEKNKHM